MQNKTAFLILLLLTGCATTTPPAIKIETQLVNVPIPIPCKATVPEKPKFSFDTLTPQDKLFKKAQTILSDRQLHLGYEGELLVALKSCINNKSTDN